MGRYVNGQERVEELGYSRILDPQAEEINAVKSAGEMFIGKKHAKPFFLSVGFFQTHRPFPEPPDASDDPRYTMLPARLPDLPEIRRDLAGYKTSARHLDAAMGSVFDAIDSACLAENTLIICTTDHGIAFPQHKCTLTDYGTGVMMIVRGPGGFTGGKVVDTMVSQVDVFPTLCELLDIEPPAWLDGVSFLPLINGKTGKIREALFAEVNYHAAYEPMRSVRTSRWKYIRRFDPRSGPVLPNCDESNSRNAMLNLGWKNQKPANESLFDLMLDPSECSNLADQAQFAAVLEDMRSLLDEWMKKTDDPLRISPIALPEEAVVNGRDQMSAAEPPSREI